MKNFYKEPNHKKCFMCGSSEGYLECLQIRESTCLSGMHFKWIGYICENCRQSSIVPIISKMQQVWDTIDFESEEIKDHLLVEPENKRDENGNLRW